MHKTGKPVRHCHDCPLNLGKRCAVFSDPRVMWSKGKCRGYKNQELYESYQEELRRHPPDKRKKKRREVAKMRQSERHAPGMRMGGGRM